MTNVHHRHIPWQPATGKRILPLGRHVLHDPRSREFPAERAAALKSVNHQAQGLPLDQADVGSCTAEALVGAGNSVPNLRKRQPRNQDDAYALYHEETVEEGQPWPPNDPGGTGLAVCKAAKKLGWVRSYRHAFGLDHALHALMIRPVMFGSNWYDSMDTPDSAGLVVISQHASIRGGHEYVADEIQLDTQMVGFWNSWNGWGPLGGRFYMSFATVERLLGEQGDATVPTFL